MKDQETVWRTGLVVDPWIGTVDEDYDPLAS